jgi:hypothetical protein
VQPAPAPFAIRVLGCDTRYRARLLVRGGLIWAAGRLAVAGFAGATGEPIVITAPAAGLLTLAVAALCAVDARMMRESVFHANLGTPTAAPALAGAAVAAVATACELLLYGLILGS